MLNAKDELLTISASLTDIKSRFYGSNFEANLQDDTQFPLLHVQKITNSSLEQNITTGLWKRSWQIFLFIGDKTDLDTTGVNLDTFEEQNAARMRRMVDLINKSGKFELISKVDMLHKDFKFDFNMSGVIGMFNLKERQGHLIC